MHRTRQRGTTLVLRRLAPLLLVLLTASVAAMPDFSAARGFPAMRDASGRALADGDFSQWVERGRLNVRIVYQFAGGRRIEERAVFRTGSPLVQEAWSWRETQNSKPNRQFAVNFLTETATAEKREGEELKHWSEHLDVELGRTFSGFGFTMAIIDLRTRLIKGEAIVLQAIGFTPKPKMVPVEITHAGLDAVRMSGRALRGDRFVIHPKIPWIAELFVSVPDTRIWLTNPTPAAFLRWEGPLAEPDDPIVRVDLLPGGRSEPAQPIGTGGRPR